MTQEKRVLKALLKGEVIDWKWGSKQHPYIADGTRICRRIKNKFSEIDSRDVKCGKATYKEWFIPIEYRAKLKDILTVKVAPI